jgi:hypothetical protein
MSAPALRPRAVALALAGAAVTLLLIANAHLVYVAVVSQPECVPHVKTEAHTAGNFRAARSSC